MECQPRGLLPSLFTCCRPGKLTIDERRPGDFEGDEGMKCGRPMGASGLRV